MEWPLTDVPDLDERRTAILRVAQECFERYGVHRTRMEDIADAAGLSRPMIYRFFATRQDLIDAVILGYVRDLAASIRPTILAYKTLPEAVVEGSVLLVEGARSNPGLASLATTSKTAHLSELLLRPTELAQAMAAEIWRPLLERARQRGEIRSDFGIEDFVEWLSSIHLIFWLRTEVNHARLRSLLWAYLAPALNPQAPIARPKRSRSR